jgi:hypothetical protein
MGAVPAMTVPVTPAAHDAVVAQRPIKEPTDDKSNVESDLEPDLEPKKGDAMESSAATSGETRRAIRCKSRCKGECEGRYESRSESRSESWLDAVVTLLATVVFGLGWALVELERADPVQDRYDAAVSIAWSSTEQLGQSGEPSESWTGVAQQRSRR